MKEIDLWTIISILEALVIVALLALLDVQELIKYGIETYN